MSYVKCCMKHARFEQLRLGSIRPTGWLKELFERNKAGMGGKMPEIEPELIGKAYRSPDCHSRFQAGWTSEIAGTYWTGLIQLAFTLDDAELKRQAENWVCDVIARQEEDGFLGVHRPEDNRFEDYCAWGNNWGYRALLCYYDATGDESVLSAVHRALLWFVNNWTDGKKTAYVGPVITDSMVTVYHLTGDQRLLEWAEEYKKWLSDSHDEFYHGEKSICRARLNYFDDHVVAFGENVKNPAVLYTATGDEDELAASRSGFRQIFDRGWQVTGAPSSHSEHFSPPSCILETEYCNFATFLNSFAWMGKITGEAAWFDRMEKILFNGAQGARLKDEKGIAYMSCPNQCSATSTDGSYNSYMTVAKRIFAPNYYVSCCPMQSVRIYPEYVRNAFFWNGEALYAAVYGPMSVIPEQGIEITEETDYPFDETLRLRFRCQDTWCHALVLRRPDWCKSYRIILNGESVAAEEDSCWLKIDGPWNDGDCLEVTFKMEAVLAPVKDAWFPIEPLRAYSYGPLLFCHEFPSTIREMAEYPPIYLQSNPAAICPVSEEGQDVVKPVSPSKEYPWYDVYVEKFDDLQWYAVPRNAKDGNGITVIRNAASSYPWDDSPVRLRVPLIRATKSWDRCGTFLTMPYENPVHPDDGANVEIVELVPFGCTLLRQSCFPVSE